jgi:hypothetical protein
MGVTVFYKHEIVARGEPGQFVAALGELQPLARSSDLLAFDDESGRQVDLDLSAKPSPRPRGRPALGVEAKEVTLLPRHWEWLSQQRGGASATLRKLVEDALRQGRTEQDCRDAAFRFLNVIAGDLPKFEEAVRAIYAGDRDRYERMTRGWPEAVRDHGRELAWPGEAL